MVSTIAILLLLSLLLPIHAQYTTDCCRTNADCEGNRACMFFEPPFTLLPCAPDLKECRCGPADGRLLTCSFDFECPEGDVCTENFDEFGCVSSNPKVAACPDTAEPAPENNPTVTPTPAPPTTTPPSPSPQPSDSSALSSDPSSNPIPSPKPPGTGLTRDICETSFDCKPPRTCIPLTEESDSEGTGCQPGQLCRCFPVDRCVVDGDCAKGEQCYDPAENSEATAGDGTFCVSRCSLLRKNDPDKFEEECKSSSTATDTPDPTDLEVVETPIPGVDVGTSVVVTSTPSVDVSTVDPGSTPDGETITPTTDVDTTTAPDEDSVDSDEATPTPTSDAVCVAAEELEGVDKVFDRDFHAWVLCDSAGSCATPGHMVIWNGQGMMMRSYCDTVGCEKKVMAVNSPRWRTKGVRAKTDGLMYTSLAARFATIAEERVLAAVVRIAM